MRKALNRFPLLKTALRRVRRFLLGAGSVSSHYVPVAQEAIERESARLRSAWKSDELPARQRDLVDQQLRRFRAGEEIDVFDVAAEALAMTIVSGRRSTVLEVGCSSGFYSEVFEIRKLPVDYSGCDYAPAFIDLARLRYPELTFEVADATSLTYPDAAFDTVISGCCLLHIPEYELAIAEASRVASRYILFHRTPVVAGYANRVFTKRAYGVETVEIHFGEPALIAMIERHGVRIIRTWTLGEEPTGEAQRTYLCEKTAATH